MKIEFGTEDTKKHIMSQYPYTAGVLSDGGSLIVAKDEKEKIIGFLWSFRRQIEAPVGEKIEDFINVIEVFEGHQCKGIGSALVQKCIEKATSEGVYQVRAYCDIHNRASHLLWAKNRFGISPIKMHNGSICGSFVTFVI